MIENRGFKSVCCAVHDVDRNFTCLWMRPRNLPHVSSSLMLPTDDSLARYLTHHHRTTGYLYRVIRQNICTEAWARLRHGGILKSLWVCEQKTAFPSRCGNVVVKSLAMRTLRGGKVAYHARHLQARQVREIELHTHTQMCENTASVWVPCPSHMHLESLQRRICSSSCTLQK